MQVVASAAQRRGVVGASACAYALGLLASSAWASLAFADEPIAPSLRYNRDVRPLLADRCFACHGPDEASRAADLRLDVREAALGGAIVPGDPEASPMVARVSAADPDVRMPPSASHKPALSATEVETLRQWIAAGAEYEPHWSYVAPRRPATPAVQRKAWPRNALDAFVLAAQEAAGCGPATEADRTTLVRRAYLDLTGLPPTLDEAEQFLLDNRPDAYERLVDRLLTSPHYAERMASWWFDLVRFADTVGYHGDQDHAILPYRDYVLWAFRQNMPFDQFTVEQLAGDLLPNPTLWQQVATGYNRVLQTSHEGGIQDAEYRAKMLADRVRNLGEAWMSASLGCAECHDHKFDPYSQREFYQLAAFFADVDHYGSFVPVADNALPTQRPPEILAWTLPVYERAEALDRRIAELQLKLRGRLPRDYRSLQSELAELQRERGGLVEQFVPTMVTQAVAPREIRVLPRGNWLDDSGPVVQPATPAALPPLRAARKRPTRLDLARWLVSGEHPLVARTVVNRLWQRLFGRALSGNPIELGSQGEWPTHPELLDWLAVELVESGWDLRHVVRLMATSAAYRQSSAPRPALDAIDPANRLLTRQARFRLDAEQVRDLALRTSGLLVDQFGGTFARPYQPAGYYAPLNFPVREYKPSTGPEQFRRAVYVHWQRQFLHPWLLAFDAPTREECTARRNVSSTPAAALVLLNDPTFVEAARGLALAALALPAADETAATDDAAKLRYAWRRVLVREPGPAELAELHALLALRRRQFAADPAAAKALLAVGTSPAGQDDMAVEIAAWAETCRALLNLQETLTRY